MPPDTPMSSHSRPLLRQLAGVALRVVEAAVAGVDDHVARLEDRGQLVDHRRRSRRPDGTLMTTWRGAAISSDEPVDRLRDGDAALVLRLRRDLGRDRLGPVPGDHLVAAARRASRHPGAHPPQSGDRDLHVRAPPSESDR